MDTTKMTQRLADCWIELYQGQWLINTPVQRFQGPTQWDCQARNYDSSTLREARYSNGQSVAGNVGSLFTGPGAWVELFETPDFNSGGSNGKVLRFGPHTAIRNLGDYDFANKLQSMKLYPYRPGSWSNYSLADSKYKSKLSTFYPDGSILQGIHAQSVNTSIQSAVTSIVKSVPEVGKVFSTLLNTFWPDFGPTPESIWGGIRDYVDTMIRGLQYKMKDEDLHSRMEGLKGWIERIVHSTNDTTRQENFKGLKDAVFNDESFFIDLQDQFSRIRYFVPFGTIALVTYWGRFTFTDQFYPDLSEQERKEQAAEWQKEMTDKIVPRYLDAAKNAKKQGISARKSLIGVDGNHSGFWKDGYWAYDQFDGWKACFTEKGGAGEAPCSGPSVDNPEAYADGARDLRKQRIGNNYEVALESLLLPTRYWKYFDPECTQKPGTRTEKKTIRLGPFGVYNSPSSPNIFKYIAPEGQRIERIRFFTGDAFDSIRVTGSDGKEHNLGAVSTGTPTVDITLDPDEEFSAILGGEYQSISQLILRTTKDRMVGTGGPPGNWYSANSPGSDWFCSPPAGSVSGKLIGIETRCGKYTDGVTFTWEYELPD